MKLCKTLCKKTPTRKTTGPSTRTYVHTPAAVASAWAALKTHYFIYEGCRGVRHTDPNCPQSEDRYTTFAASGRMRAFVRGTEPATCKQCPACASGVYTPPKIAPHTDRRWALQGATLLLELSDTPPLPRGLRLVSLRATMPAEFGGTASFTASAHDVCTGMCAAGRRRASFCFEGSDDGHGGSFYLAPRFFPACRQCASWRVVMQAVEATQLPAVIKFLIYACL